MPVFGRCDIKAGLPCGAPSAWRSRPLPLSPPEEPRLPGESLLGAPSRREEAALLTFLKWLLEMSRLTA